VLQELARRLAAMVREGDLVARWGGEEFLLLLTPGTSGPRALVFAERLLGCVAGTPFDAGMPQALDVTVSAGVVCWPAWPGEPWAQALERADLALYRAKAQGRNRAVHAHVDGPDAAAAPTWSQVQGPVPGSGEGRA
jgi:diguanylate cyclase (GGDEF)-like protein